MTLCLLKKLIVDISTLQKISSNVMKSNSSHTNPEACVPSGQVISTDLQGLSGGAALEIFGMPININANSEIKYNNLRVFIVV